MMEMREMPRTTASLLGSILRISSTWCAFADPWALPRRTPVSKEKATVGGRRGNSTRNDGDTGKE